MKKEVTYDSLPNAVAELSEKLNLLVEIVSTKIEKKEEIPKYFDKKQALRHMANSGIKISESKLYKMTSQNNIPYHKSGNKLYFMPEELDEWMNEQIIGKGEINKHFSIQTIINKNQKKKK